MYSIQILKRMFYHYIYSIIGYRTAEEPSQLLEFSQCYLMFCADEDLRSF